MTEMDKVNMCAEEIYERATHLGVYDEKSLRRRECRSELALWLSEMCYWANRLQEALTQEKYPYEYHTLAEEMQEYFEKNLTLILKKPWGYRKRLIRRFKGLSSVPLAFFTHRPSVKTSVDDAVLYLKIHKR